MATKKTKKRASKAPRKATASPRGKPAKASAKKRASKAPRKATASSRGKPAKKTTAKAAAKKRASSTPKKRRATLAPTKATRPTKPARPRAKKASAASAPAPSRKEEAASSPRESGVRPLEAAAPVSPRVTPRPEPPPPPERVASYLESVPQDRTELVAGLFQVARGAAKDLRTLFTQALTISHQRRDR